MILTLDEETNVDTVLDTLKNSGLNNGTYLSELKLIIGSVESHSGINQLIKIPGIATIETARVNQTL